MCSHRGEKKQSPKAIDCPTIFRVHCASLPSFLLNLSSIESNLDYSSLLPAVASSLTLPVEVALGYPHSSLFRYLLDLLADLEGSRSVLKRHLPTFPKCPKAQRISKNQFRSRFRAMRSFMRLISSSCSSSSRR